MGREALAEALGPIFDVLLTADPAAPGLAESLNESLPVDGDVCRGVRAVAETGIAEGWLCNREAGGSPFSRRVRPCPESSGFSVDAVVMDRVKGPKHTHTNGEINLCFTQDGEARFDGNPEGWVVFEPGSTHSPLVQDGRMLILYFLPGGAIEFHG